MELGLCENSYQIYEGRGRYGHILNPSPVVSPCKIVTDKSACTVGPDSKNPSQGLIFREDYFDPKSRIRRGRIYSAFNSQPHEWRSSAVGDVLGSMITYGKYSLWAEYQNQRHHDIYILLGDENRFTVWRVVNIEVITSREELLTLKALTTYGVLPELMTSMIPPHELDIIKRQLDNVIDDMHTATADSVVDCCREAATAILGAYLNKPDKDLGSLKNELANSSPPKHLAKDMANTIALLHSRRKTAEQRGKNLRQITEEDAQLAVSCLGMIMVEIGWGRW